MGAGHTKVSPVSYDEACKRGKSVAHDTEVCPHAQHFMNKLYLLFLVDDKVLQRLDEAFRRNASASGYLPQATFVRDVLGEAAPSKLSEVSGNSIGSA